VLVLAIGAGGTFENTQACLICISVMAFLIVPIALEVGADFVYPLSSALSSSLIWVGTYVVALASGITVDEALVDYSASKPRFSGGHLLFLGLFALACAMWWMLPVRCAFSRGVLGTAPFAMAAPQSRTPVQREDVPLSEFTARTRLRICGVASGLGMSRCEQQRLLPNQAPSLAHCGDSTAPSA
jgi:hypothetical protein